VNCETCRKARGAAPLVPCHDHVLQRANGTLLARQRSSFRESTPWSAAITLPPATSTVRIVSRRGPHCRSRRSPTRTAKYVVADVHSRVNLLTGPAEKLVAQAERPLAGGDAAQVVGALDRPVLHSQQLSTTLRIPVGHPALIRRNDFPKRRGK